MQCRRSGLSGADFTREVSRRSSFLLRIPSKRRSNHTRKPGPSKTLDPTPRRLEDLRGLITDANDWSAPPSFLHRLAYAGDVAGTYTSLQNGTLTRYLLDGPEKTELPDQDVPVALADVFGADPSLYIEAAEVRRRYSPAQR